MACTPYWGDGSAPRLRGTEQYLHPAVDSFRFSPAPAGNGEASYRRASLRPVQPRACGERSAPRGFAISVDGSAPRLRGTVHEQGRRLDAERFSPAPAGNGIRREAARPRATVQPRACGERALSCWSMACFSGSAPRLRGTGSERGSMATTSRFSPAPAGNGIEGRHRILCAPVQPRACGERRKSWGALPAPAGSAPRLRGTALARTRDRASRRFSPAPAGNGSSTVPSLFSLTVQPRACGERGSSTIKRS